MPAAHFIAFEGGEGSGKSTQARLLADHLRAQGHRVLLTREPGGSPRGERIRELILGPESDGLNPRTEALLFAAARADHAATLIRPALSDGQTVITDRYVDSSVAYQGVARGLGPGWIRELSRWGTQDLRPDLTVVLDVDPLLGLSRAKDQNRLESEPLSFHQGVRMAFLDLAAANPTRYRVVPGDLPQAEVHRMVSEAVGELAVQR